MAAKKIKTSWGLVYQRQTHKTSLSGKRVSLLVLLNYFQNAIQNILQMVVFGEMSRVENGMQKTDLLTTQIKKYYLYTV